MMALLPTYIHMDIMTSSHHPRDVPHPYLIFIALSAPPLICVGADARGPSLSSYTQRLEWITVCLVRAGKKDIPPLPRRKSRGGLLKKENDQQAGGGGEAAVAENAPYEMVHDDEEALSDS